MNDNVKQFDRIAIDKKLLFDILDLLRLNYIYVLMGSEFEDDLPDDFKPHKWQGFEKKHAELSSRRYKELLKAMEKEVYKNNI